MLKLINIHKDYYVNKRPLHVLKGIDLTFPKQQYVTILGPSGCGKTTLLNLIGGLDKYTSGDLIIEGKSTKEFKDSDWDAYRNHSVGFVFQSYNLIAHFSVLENVEISLTLTGISPQERRQRAIDALIEVGLEEEIYKKSNQLSGGQMQRVAIARAIVNNPSIILADEPTGALDTKTSGQVLDILKEVSKTRLVIMVSHNEKLAQAYSDRIIRMVDGKITSDSLPGKVKEVVIDEEVTEEKVKGTAMSFPTALRSSYKNILTKKGRTILTALAGSLGIIGIGLVSAVSNGFQNYIDRMEQETMASYPMAVLSQSISLEAGFQHPNVDEKYPDIEEIKVYDRSDREAQGLTFEYNIINEEVIEFAKSLKDDDLASSILVNYPNKMRVIYEGPVAGEYGFVDRVDRLSGITPLPTGNFTQMPGDKDYVLEFYDLLGGEEARFPENENEVVLVIDAYNKISLQTLTDLGILGRADRTELIAFSDIIGHEFKALANDEFYTDSGHENKIAELDILTMQVQKEIKTFFEPNQAGLKQRYEDDAVGVKLNITGILRPKKNIQLSLIPAGIAYTNELSDKMQTLNASNEIGKAAINNLAITELPDFESMENLNDLMRVFKFYSPYARSDGKLTELTAAEFLQIGKDVGALAKDLELSPLLGEEFETMIRGFFTLNFSPAESIAIFPKDSASKKLIKDKFAEYNAKMISDHGPEMGELYKIKLFDAVEVVTDSLATMIDIISIVLIVFTSISLVVSGFLIGIITYVSVIERTKEIGILRAIGARKKDVSRLFNAETFIIGLLAGLIGVVSTYILSIPINLVLNYVFPDQGIGQIAFLAPLTGLFLIAFNISLTVVAGLIPSRMAANKDPVVALRTE